MARGKKTTAVNSEERATGQRVGYIRVSSVEQNTAHQLEEEKEKLDKVFEDKCSGKDTHRPQLQALFEYVREGDTIVVHSLDRLARNLGDLRSMVDDLTGRGIKIQFLKENLTFSGDDSSMSKLLLSIMGAFAEFERALIRERQREGIAEAKKRGVYKGRKKSLSEEQQEELKRRVGAGEKKTALAKEFHISRETLYQYMRA
jgi:DNA invertase Pin-like site-specific DNA recombinase